MSADVVPRELRGLGWTWTEHGPIVHLDLNGSSVAVLVPLRRVRVEFGRELAAVGYPYEAVGAVESVGGFFSSIKKAVKRVGKAAKGAVRKAAKGVSRVARKYGTKALAYGKRIVRDKRFRAGLAIASVAVPALAPAAAAVETANRALDYYERGKRVAERVARGIERPGDVAKLAAGAAAQEAIGVIAQRAQRGDVDAQRFVGGLHAVQAARAFRRGRPFAGFNPRAFG